MFPTSLVIPIVLWQTIITGKSDSLLSQFHIFVAVSKSKPLDKDWIVHILSSCFESNFLKVEYESSNFHLTVMIC